MLTAICLRLQPSYSSETVLVSLNLEARSVGSGKF